MLLEIICFFFFNICMCWYHASCSHSDYYYLFIWLYFGGALNNCCYDLREPIQPKLLARLVGQVESLGRRNALVEPGMEHCVVHRWVYLWILNALPMRRGFWYILHRQQFRGGATMHGPKPRSHAFKLNKKVRRLGLKIALSDCAANGKASTLLLKNGIKSGSYDCNPNWCKTHSLHVQNSTSDLHCCICE